MSKISSKLQVFIIKYLCVTEYLNADRWEQLINEHIPYLRRFELVRIRYSDFSI